MEVGKHTAKYLVHCLPEDLKELIYIHSTLDMDGNIQFIKFIILIGSGVFSEGKTWLDESKILDQANGFAGPVLTSEP